MPLDAEASRRGLDDRIGTPLSFDARHAAVGVFDVVMARTAGKVREVTVERGRDPQTFSLLVFGGACLLLGPLLARELDIRELVVPIAPSVFSALGMLAAEVTDDHSLTALRPLSGFSLEELEQHFVELEERAAAALEEQGVAQNGLSVSERSTCATRARSTGSPSRCPPHSTSTYSRARSIASMRSATDT